jgi:NADP-dependent 3-hydroxy acid dehydrogenase YdfG
LRRRDKRLSITGETDMRIKDFKGKKCFITGAASGIGKATAAAMANLGAELFLTDINAKHLDEVATEIKKTGGKVSLWHAFDISNYEEVKKFSERIHSEFGSMDIVMNIAGIAIWGTVDRLRHEHWVKVMNVNLMGPIYVMESFLPEMIKARRGGHLVNVTSTAGLFGYPWHAAYSGSKAGLNGVSEVLRYDLMQHGIGVTVICPGAVATNLRYTVEVYGINMKHEEAKKFLDRFSKHALPPEKVASQIIDAIKKNKFLVITSFDVKLLYWVKKRLFFIYHAIMKKANTMFANLAEKAGT